MSSKFVVALFFFLHAGACGKPHDHHDHSEEHPTGHDHHESGHGHTDGPVVRITQWNEAVELFAEHPRAIASQELEFLVHVTLLPHFAPMIAGNVTLQLTGPAELSGAADVALRPGIFKLSVKPPMPGVYRGVFLIQHDPAQPATALAAFDLNVFGGNAAAAPPPADAHDEGSIELLKEQQWAIPFATEFVTTRALVASVEAPGVVGTPPDGQAIVSATVGGRIVPFGKGLPRPGQQVRKGQVLATLAATPSAPEDAARARFLVMQAQGDYDRAKLAAERAARLLADASIAKREWEDANRESELATAALASAKQIAATMAGATTGTGAGTWQLKAPIDGTLVHVHARPGQVVAAGAPLFELVDASELWLIANVPEHEAAQLQVGQDASFKLAGGSEWFPLALGGANPSAKVIASSRVIDPVSRTVAVIYGVRNPPAALRVGASLLVAVPLGAVHKGVVVPRTALVDDGGRFVAYVQRDGEHFEERVVSIGAQAGGLISVTSGLAEGERVVTQGANVVRIVARTKTSGPAAGHIH